MKISGNQMVCITIRFTTLYSETNCPQLMVTK